MTSAEHNTVESFRQDQGRRVYLVEGEDRFWYFGANNSMPALKGFADQFPWLIRSGQGFAYVADVARILAFTGWLSSLGKNGVLGKPRNQQIVGTHRHLKSIDPEPLRQDTTLDVEHRQPAGSCRRPPARYRAKPREVAEQTDSIGESDARNILAGADA